MTTLEDLRRAIPTDTRKPTSLSESEWRLYHESMHRAWRAAFEWRTKFINVSADTCGLTVDERGEFVAGMTLIERLK